MLVAPSTFPDPLPNPFANKVSGHTRHVVAVAMFAKIETASISTDFNLEPSLSVAITCFTLTGF